MLEKDINDKRKERHYITQEDFTPDTIVDMMLMKLPKDTFVNFDTNIMDNSCGIGNFIVEVLRRRLANCKLLEDAIEAVKSIYGIELMADNVEECRNRLYSTFIEAFPHIDDNDIFIVRSIIKNRIQWYDSLKFDYSRWPELDISLDNIYEVSFKELPSERDTKYPMWFKEELKDMEQSLF